MLNLYGEPNRSNNKVQNYLLKKKKKNSTWKFFCFQTQMKKKNLNHSNIKIIDIF